jgi:hypothetical protein
VDLRKPLVFVISLGIFLLVVFLDAYTFKVSPEHVAVLEVVVRGPFVVGMWLFEHFVKNAPARGPSRFLAISSSNKVIGRGLELALLVLFLLPVVLLGNPAGAHGILFLVLPLILIATKDGTNCLLAGGEVGDNIHQTVGSDGSAAAQLSAQLFAGGTREESHDDVGVGDVGELGALLGETPDVIPEGFTRLLFAASKIPRVAGAHVGSHEVPLEHSHEVVLVVDLLRWEVLELGSSGVRQEQGELSNDDPVVGGSTQLTSQAEVSEPKFEFGLAVILDKSRGGAELS